jgi:hypothetical protein
MVIKKENIMKQIFPLGLFVILFLAACAGPSTSQPATGSNDSLEMTVFRSPA